MGEAGVPSSFIRMKIWRALELLSDLFIIGNKVLIVDNVIERIKRFMGGVYLSCGSRLFSHRVIAGPAFSRDRTSTAEPAHSLLDCAGLGLLIGQETETVFQPFFVVFVRLPEQVQVKPPRGECSGAFPPPFWQLPSYAPAKTDVERSQTLLSVEHSGQPAVRHLRQRRAMGVVALVIVEYEVEELEFSAVLRPPHASKETCRMDSLA